MTINTPAYVVSEALLRKNLEILRYVKEKTGCKILLAQKAFSMYHVYPLISEYLDGTTASSLHEARLGYEEMGKPYKRETHIFAPAFKVEEMPEILAYCDHIVFNTPSQLYRFLPLVKENAECTIEIGLRINPEYSEIETDIYNPCCIGSRMGTIASCILEEDYKLIDGLHFHTMCEQGADTLERTLKVVEEKFGKYLHGMKWINFGGGHHISKEGYDIEKLIRCIRHIQETYGVIVYLEPGEAIALNAGFLETTVLDTMQNGIDIAITDASAACHMPDVLEMPYRPFIIGSGMPDEKKYTYRLAGATCLAGDVIGDYSFDQPLQAGDTLVFTDMAIYSMVKNNTFNGVRLPNIVFEKADGTRELIKTFDYGDFKRRI